MKITQKIFETVTRVSKKYSQWKRTPSLCTLYIKFNDKNRNYFFSQKTWYSCVIVGQNRFRSRTGVGQYDSKLRKLSDIHLTEIDSKYKLIIEL